MQKILTIAVNPFKAAAFGAAVVCALLLLQYAHRRKLFILAWSAGWLTLAPMSLLLAQPYSAKAENAALKALAPAFNTCLKGKKLGAGGTELRSMLALAAFRNFRAAGG